jgi:tetratricopeptide (TPR) repeat protein
MSIDYEQGLEQLKQYLRGTAWEHEFSVYEARLRENLDREQRYGTNEQIRADRAPIIDQLNRLAMQVNTTFNDLCLNRQTLPEQTPTNIWNVPYPRNPLFTGREAELHAIETALSEGQQATIVQTQAISGLGGIGKTQLALEYAYRHRAEYRYVFWALADTRDTLNAAYSEIANQLNLPERQQREQHRVVEAVKNWLATHQDWLLILDNADDLQMVRDFLPTSAPGHILLTTRAHAMGRLAERIEIKKLEEEEGISFLLRRSTLLHKNAPLKMLDTSTHETARQIVRELDGLPLALDQTGAYIEETNCSLQDYLKLYRTQRTGLLRLRGGLIADHPEPVATTWQLAFDRIEASNAGAADLLRLCAFLAPDDIPETIIGQGMTELTPPLQQLAGNSLQLNAALAALQAYSLVTRHPDTHTLDVHRLVQAVLRDAMPKKAERAWAERAVRLMEQIFPWPEVANWEVCRQLLPHAQVCAAIIKSWQMELYEGASLLNKVGWYLKDRAEYNEAQEYSEQALAILGVVSGSQHLDTAIGLNNLAVVYQVQGKYAEAEDTHQQALAIWRAVLGEQHPDTAHSLEGLAIFYRAQEKYEQAEALYQQALAIYQTLLGDGHPDTARCLFNIAALYQKQKKYPDALTLFERALAIWLEKLGPEYPYTKKAQRNVEKTLQAMKRNAGEQGTDAEQT